MDKSEIDDLVKIAKTFHENLKNDEWIALGYNLGLFTSKIMEWNKIYGQENQINPKDN